MAVAQELAPLDPSEAVAAAFERRRPGRVGTPERRRRVTAEVVSTLRDEEAVAAVVEAELAATAQPTE